MNETGSKQYLNPIASVAGKYQSKVTSPALQAAILAGAGIPLMYMLKRPLFKGLNRLARDPRVATVLGMRPAEVQ